MSINEVSDAWRELFEKGQAALERHNLDYAIDIFTQILQKEPAFFECRVTLRSIQLKKAASGGTGFFKKTFGAVSSGPLITKGRMFLRSNPAEAMHIAEQALNSDPNSTMAHELLADAAIEADLPRTAVLSLEILYKSSPRDVKLVRKLAENLVRVGQSERAEALYGELIRANPTNNQLVQELKNISAQRTMQEGGYDALSSGQGSYRDILKNKDEAQILEQEQREVHSEDTAVDLIKEYEGRLVKDPDNIRLIRSLAELHVQKEHYDLGLHYYQMLVERTTGSDPSLEKAVIETQLKKLDHAMAQLDANTPEGAEALAKLKKERLEFQVNEGRKRVEKYPTDLQIHFELGEIYFEAGRIGEAIQEFQKSQNSPHRRIQSLSYLGQCFGRRNMNDLAARAFQNAIKEKVVFDDEKKELIYHLGCVLEKMGKKEEAIDQFKLIYESDIGFRDVAAKVDAYYESQ